MNYNIDDKTVGRLITNVGLERLVAALPQKDLRKALEMVSIRELARMMAMNESTMRWHVAEGRIPYPQVRLVRRGYYTREEAEAIAKAWKARN